MISKLIINLLLITTTIKSNTKNNVITITEKYLKEKPFEKADYLLFFGSPKCPFCMKMLSTWKTLADVALLDGIKTGSINCLYEKKICNSFGVKQFPTVYLVKENLFYKFNGRRSLENFVGFYKEKFKMIDARSFQDIIDLKDGGEFGDMEIFKELVKASPLTLLRLVKQFIYLIFIIAGYFIFFTFYDCFMERKKTKSSNKTNKTTVKKNKEEKKRKKMEKKEKTE